MDTSFERDESLILDKEIYGLGQTARQFHRRLTEVMEKQIGFKKCVGEECLLMRKTNQGTVCVYIYIDDTLCTGNKEAIQEFKIK